MEKKHFFLAFTICLFLIFLFNSGENKKIRFSQKKNPLNGEKKIAKEQIKEDLKVLLCSHSKNLAAMKENGKIQYTQKKKVLKGIYPTNRLQQTYFY